MNMARRRRELNALIALDRKVVRQIYVGLGVLALATLAGTHARLQTLRASS